MSRLLRLWPCGSSRDHGRGAVRRTLAIPSGLVLLFGLAGSGCSSTEKIHLTESGAPDFQRLAIVYDVNSVGSLAFRDEPSAVRPAGLVDSGHADPPPPGSRLRLEIQYPYPGVNPDFVHATLRILPPGTDSSADFGLTSGPPTGLRGFSNANSRGGGLMSPTVGPAVNRGPKPGEEWLVIDMPKSELSALFVDLANDGFFQRPNVSGGESHLEVMYNQALVDKVWTREPHLEQLVDLLKRHGTPTVAQPPSGPLPGFYTGRNGKS
jgi:hypothetical protein